jgi:hypothetical protein
VFSNDPAHDRWKWPCSSRPGSPSRFRAS